MNAQAIWTADGVEVRWRVWTLSWGGIGLVTRSDRPAVGTRLHVRLAQPGGDLGYAHVEVVHTTGRRVGLRFIEIDAALESSLEDLFSKLTPLT